MDQSIPESKKPINEQKLYWRDNLAISLAESIFILTQGSKEWRETVFWMLSGHEQFLKNKGMNCPTYNPEFVNFVSNKLGSDVCHTKQ